MDKLVQQNSDKEVLRALENLPEGIDEIYNDAMERIEKQNEVNKRLAKRVLAWITHARRPLTVEELQHALAVSANMTSKMDPAAIIYETKMTSICAGLVVIDGQRIIRLARE
jgi:DNA-binding transcriptional regulator GbsR (MarR family)